MNSYYLCDGWFQQVRGIALPRIARDFTLVVELRSYRGTSETISFSVFKILWLKDKISWIGPL